MLVLVNGVRQQSRNCSLRVLRLGGKIHWVLTFLPQPNLPVM